MCDESEATPRCVCRAAFTGTDCAECAAGYVPRGDGCAPVTVDCSDDPCAHGTCVEGADGDRCECDEAHAGPTCAQCGPDYQDNDGDGTCAASCERAGPLLECAEPLVCRDISGIAECGCPGMTDGEGCLGCVPGHYRLGDGPCVPSCAVLEDCGERRHCFDDGTTGARCVCDVGPSGDDCADCAEGFTREGELCTRATPEGHLMAIADVEGAPALVSIEPRTGATVPLRSLPEPEGFSSWSGLIVDRASGRMFVEYRYADGSDSLVTAGEVLPDSTVRRLGRSAPLPLVFHPPTQKLYGLEEAYRDGALAQLLRVVDPADLAGSAGISIDTNLPAGDVRAMAWDSAESRVYAHLWSDGDWNLYSLDVGSGEATVVLEAAERGAGIASIRPHGLSILDGEMWIATTFDVPAEEEIEDRCRLIASSLGYEDAETAPMTAPIGSEGPSWTPSGPLVELRTSRASGPEIVGWKQSLGSNPAEPATLAIQSTNPDAFYCVLATATSLLVRFDAGTAPRGYIDLTTVGNGITVEVSPDFLSAAGTPPAPLAVRVFDATWGGELSAHPSLFRRMSDNEYEARRIGSWASTPDPLPGALLATLEEGRWTAGALLPYALYALDGGT